MPGVAAVSVSQLLSFVVVYLATRTTTKLALYSVKINSITKCLAISK